MSFVFSAWWKAGWPSQDVAKAMGSASGLHGLEEVFDEVSLLVAAQHEGDARDLGDLLAFQLGVAARHDHDGARILPHHLVDLLATFMVRHLRHRTSVDQADVCSFARVRLADTHII